MKLNQIDDILGLIVTAVEDLAKTAKKTKVAKGAKALKPAMTDAEIEDILARGGLTRADLAKRYPEVGKPVPAIDKKTGKPYLAKGESREAAAVAEVRDRLNAEIKRGQYETPYDVNARYDANVANYPRPDVTISDTPSRPPTIEKYRELYAGPASKERINAAIDAAINDPGARGFYKLGQLEDDFIRILGPEEGVKAFEERVMNAMAATTGGADPTSNLLMASLGNYMKTQRGPRPRGINMPPPEFPSRAYEMPYPVGGRYASGNMAMYDKMIGVDTPGAGVTPANPKRYDFANAFGGHRDRSVIDEQMMGLIDPASSGAPAKNTYGMARQAVDEVARERGLAPIEGQEIAWAGAKKVAGKPMISHYNEAIWRTMRLTGLTKDQVIEGMARGTIPIYGLAGATIGGGLLGDQQENEIERYLRESN